MRVLAPSPEAGCRPATSTSGRRGLLWRLRDKQARLGLFEIGPGHELHQLTCMMQAGLWAATQVSMDHPPTTTWGPPTEEDFSEVLTQVHEGFELGTLAGPAFAWLRHSLGLAEGDYQAALGPGGPYLQFLSTSKSKCHDQRFFLKTQRRREVRALLAHLPRYVQHLQRHPHSLLARLLGVHSLRVARGKKKFFIIMQSVFYPAGRISERYDIKGCEVSRWVEPAPEGSPLVLVLKDLNFQGKTIDLGICVEPSAPCLAHDEHSSGGTDALAGPQRSWLLHQMELDTAFLRELNVLDYSLLMAFQHLHEDERGPGSSLIFRTARDPGVITMGTIIMVSPCLVVATVLRMLATSLIKRSATPKPPEMDDPKQKFGKYPNTRLAQSDPADKMQSQGLPSVRGVQSPEEPGSQNRRLLPDSPNALHILDGPEQRYFLGLVDLSTVYGLRKRLEHLWKTLRYPGRTFSTVSPARYARRLCQWVEAHTE
ncbi:phosphatidylinositol 4-phosphate 5-kinase-like protein 1 [Prionailurus iriomotensis]